MSDWPYPIGPLSLVELDYWVQSATRFQPVRYAGVCIPDIVTWANKKKAETGIYPTFGHIDVRTRRWIGPGGVVTPLSLLRDPLDALRAHQNRR
jgi:hypothetical protein